MRLQTPKGFRDYLPKDAFRRKVVLGKIVNVFEKFGLDPLETPSLEYEETLKGKYGEEEKLIYKFETPGGDKVALKYDQTVPLARVVAQYGPTGQQVLPIPFKRYQIQSAYRGENPQRGRYREFLQCDADIIGLSSPLADAEILGIVSEVYKSLGLKVLIKINDRQIISDIEPKFLAAIDKLNKIGRERVLEELQNKGKTKSEAESLLEKVESLKESENLKEIKKAFIKLGYPESILDFDPALVRGLDYYTGLIFEVVLESDPNSSSLCGGGRWDKMIGKFTGNDLPAVGFAIGVDRTVEAMVQAEVLDLQQTASRVLVTIFSSDLKYDSLEIAGRLRESGIPAELWLDEEFKIDKQLKYADSKGIPFALILGPEEVQSKKFVLKDLKQRSQQSLTLDELMEKLSS